MKAPAEKMYPSKAVDIVGKRLSKALEYCPIPFVTCWPGVRPGLWGRRHIASPTFWCKRAGL